MRDPAAAGSSLDWFGVVDPGHLGRSLGGWLVAWALGVAAAREPGEGPFEVRTNVPAADAAAHRLLASPRPRARPHDVDDASRPRGGDRRRRGLTGSRSGRSRPGVTSARSGRSPRRPSKGTTGTSRAPSSRGRPSGIRRMTGIPTGSCSRSARERSWASSPGWRPARTDTSRASASSKRIAAAGSPPHSCAPRSWTSPRPATRARPWASTPRTRPAPSACIGRSGWNRCASRTSSSGPGP